MKSAKQTATPEKKTPKRERVVHKGAKGEIPMPDGLEPGYHRWGQNSVPDNERQGGPKSKDVVGRTTVNSDTAEVLDCISIGPKKGEDFHRTVIKGGAEVPIDTNIYIYIHIAQARRCGALKGLQTNASTSAKRKSWRWGHKCR